MMGALIQTRGTQRLVRHYNDLFTDKQNNFVQNRNKIVRDVPLTALFDTATTGNARPVRDIILHDPTFFFPPAHAQHPNLHKRWQYYLINELQPANQEKLRGFLSAALNLRSGVNGRPGTNANGDDYVAIHFDCIQAGPGQAQTVLQSDEYKLKGAGHNDDTGLLRNTAFSLIILVTDPIKNAPDPEIPRTFSNSQASLNSKVRKARTALL